MTAPRRLFEAPAPSSGLVLAEIDGLRAVASTNVIVCHALAESKWQPEWLRPLLDGGIGVQLFFVLSGFLLSLPFLRAQSRGERVELGPYALRRILRILPAYYVNLGLCILFLWPEALTTVMGVVTVFAHLTLTFGVSAAMVRAINPPYWTLCVEEQFYLLLPLVARLFTRRSGPLLIALTLLVPNVSKWIYERAIGAPSMLLQASLPFHWTGFALGIVIAILFHRYGPIEQARRGARSVSLVMLTLGGLALVYLAGPLFFEHQPVPLQVWALGWALVLIGVLWGPRWIGAPLRWKPVRALGLMTFSVYLWHWPVAGRVFALSDAPTTAHSALVRVVAVFCFTLLFATGSYVLVERPFMDLRRRLERARRTV